MGVIVYETKGSAFERGFQEGQNRAEEIATAVEGLLQDQALVHGLGAGDPKAALQMAERLLRRRLADVPDLRLYPELHGMAQEIEEELTGLADGAGVPFSHAALYRQSFYLSHAVLCKRLKLPSSEPSLPACTAVAFTETLEGPIAAHNADSTLPYPSWECKIPLVRPDTGYATIEAMNEVGLALLGVSCGVFNDEASPETFPVDVQQMGLRRCSSTTDALEMLTRYNLFWGPGLLLVADSEGHAAVVEKSASRYAIRSAEACPACPACPERSRRKRSRRDRSGREHSRRAGAVFCTEGVMLHQDMAPFLEAGRARHLIEDDLGQDSPDFQYFRDTKVRYDNLARLVLERQGCFSLSTLKEVLSDHSPFPHAICRHGGPDTSPYDHTISVVKSIALLKERKYLVSAYQDGLFPCQREYVALTF